MKSINSKNYENKRMRKKNKDKNKLFLLNFYMLYNTSTLRPYFKSE